MTIKIISDGVRNQNRRNRRRGRGLGRPFDRDSDYESASYGSDLEDEPPILERRNTQNAQNALN